VFEVREVHPDKPYATATRWRSTWHLRPEPLASSAEVWGGPERHRALLLGERSL